MANKEEHAQHTYRLYGVYARDLHRWMDLPSQTRGQSHRMHRHDAGKPPPFSAIAKYGYDMARKLQIAHLELDEMLWGPVPELPIWQEGNWIYKRTNGRTYKKRLNGTQPQWKLTQPETPSTKTPSATPEWDSLDPAIRDLLLRWRWNMAEMVPRSWRKEWKDDFEEVLDDKEG